MRLMCWLFDHTWFWTVVTQHDAQSWEDDYEWYRGIWHERICTNCGKQEAVFQESVKSWNIVLDDPVEEKPTQYFAFPDDWSKESCL